MSLFSLFIVLAVPIGTIQTVTTKYIAEFLQSLKCLK